MCAKHAAQCAGDRQSARVIEKILRQHEIFGHQRFVAQLSVGPMPHGKVMRAIELLGTEVAPAVRKALGFEAGDRGWGMDFRRAKE